VKLIFKSKSKKTAQESANERGDAYYDRHMPEVYMSLHIKKTVTKLMCQNIQRTAEPLQLSGRTYVSISTTDDDSVFNFLPYYAHVQKGS
jgi:hypothetical protein